MLNYRKLLFIGMLLILLLAAGACSPAQPTENITEEPVVQTEQPAPPPTLAPTQTPQEVVEEPVETEETAQDETDQAAASVETSACVECHTNQVKLIDTADPVEELESENEGAG
jgi:hypothetical protein